MAERKTHNLIDEVIHQRTRLAIMATLAGVENLGFGEIKAELGLTDGNLSAHLAALEQAGYVKIRKSFKGRKPQTTLSITAKGRKALEKYVNRLQEILNKAR
ncbi:MAG: transcriptional regulator [Planctomycetota bacterium]|nr:transcriptional regulator [Planctomycetota bacterium]